MEWACRTESDGIANRYELDLDGLSVLDLESGEFSILNWLAILADNREFNVSTPLAREGLRYLLDNCLIDMVVGGKIDIRTAIEAAHDPDYVQKKLKF